MVGPVKGRKGARPDKAQGAKPRKPARRRQPSVETTTPPPPSDLLDRNAAGSALLLGLLSAQRPLRDGLSIKQQIGQGGAGIVFEGFDANAGRPVALKALLPSVATNRTAVYRFSREARLTSAMDHPNIVKVFGIEQHAENIYFIVEELLEGSTFGEYLRRQGRLKPLDVLECLVPIMGALAAAHHKGVVHRDVKPDNIFLVQTQTQTFLPKLIDFGIAKMASESGAFESIVTEYGAWIGTPAYMSPEQATPGAEVDARTDIWSLGVVLFEALAGERPFPTTDKMTLLAMIKHEQPLSLATVLRELSPELVGIVDRALRRDPAQRYPTMVEMLTAVLRYAETEDPTFGKRHGGSMPPGFSAILDGSATRYAEISSIRHESLAPSGPLLDEPAPDDDEEAPVTSRDEYTGALAERDLHLNNLDNAVQFAEEAIANHPDSLKLRGEMRLVQTVACRWLGRFLAAERHAEEARRALLRKSAAWFSASGHFAVVLANVGKREPLESLVGELAQVDVTGDLEATGAQIQALGQGVISLMRLGLEGQAHRAFETARKLAQTVSYSAAEIRVWIDLAEAEICLQAGDHMKFLRFVEDAMDAFNENKDVKNACLCHANVGNALIQLGDFQRAELRLDAAIRLGEPMHLGFLALVRANLSFALIRLDRFDEAEAVLDQANRGSPEHSYVRLLSVCQIYRAELYRAQGKLHEAKAYAVSGVHMSVSIRAIHARALGVLGHILLQQGHASDALRQSSEAMTILDELKNIEEGDTLIRLVHCRALLAREERTRAHGHLVDARQRLNKRADRIADPKLRRRFLENVPENRETLALAAAELDRRA